MLKKSVNRVKGYHVIREILADETVRPLVVWGSAIDLLQADILSMCYGPDVEIDFWYTDRFGSAENDWCVINAQTYDVEVYPDKEIARAAAELMARKMAVE